ncbi:MAG: preprotein translocase subunit SecA [Opitutales bacterium]|nr:preprotein translocase subunit SecA [Opitutales bacterium]MCH8541107.1 preprotein translocase subunit SecA [Opitutales bacterium]
MFKNLLKSFSGRHYRKFYKKCRPVVERINTLEQEYQSLSDDALKAKTGEFRERLKNGETLDDLLPEAFAVVKNTARRLCGQTFQVCGQELPWEMVHYDVQLMGGMALHEGKIAEMSTGEGKTLVSTLPLYLNALSGRNTQLVTVNDYLALRDSEWMGQIFNYLGLTVGCLQNSMPAAERKKMYACDITYGTASEFGFDYLRDNGMATRKEDQVQRDHFFVIIDEVDSILVDEARTPLIISGPAPIDRQQPFVEYKAQVSSLVNRQNALCNRLITEAKEEWEKPEEERDDWAASLKMLQVKLGAPKNKQLLRLMETPEYRKVFDKTDLEMHGDFRKKEFFALKEELFYVIDEKQHQADLTEKGRSELSPDDPDGFIMPDLPTRIQEIDSDESLSPEEREKAKAAAQENFENTSERIHVISQLLRAYSLYERDNQYVVQDGKVQIVDENTGRLMPGRRWGDGLHQAVEAKEGVKIEKETRTYATITIQNYFRMYEKLSGMTGTAETEATEFNDIYKIGVVVIPTHKPCIRDDQNDVIYKTRRAKYNAALRDIEEAHKRGQPVLVGTASVDASEVLSRMLKRAKIPCSVLNAKFHQEEAQIIARAGQKGAVTISTNMAGRGTDIKLGPGVDELGGLLVIGTERHESRRIDRQLRGRCARQGDPGRSKFYISLEDDLMRLFANAGPLSKLMEKSLGENDELSHPLLNRSIENAQKKVEQQNYAVRKRLLSYDDVLNQQREVIYGIRNDALTSETPREIIFEMIDEELEVRIDEAGPGRRSSGEEPDLEGLVGWLNTHFPISVKVEELDGKNPKELRELLNDKIKKAYDVKVQTEEPEALLTLERYVVIRGIDKHWQAHLTEMEDLKRSIGLRSYGQKNPLTEYKGEAYRYFEELMVNVRREICAGLFRSASNVQAFEKMLQMLRENAKSTGPAPSDGAEAGSLAQSLRAGAAAAAGNAPGASKKEVKLPEARQVKRDLPKVGRNDPCPCGSGKKYKKCCGA